MSVMLLLPAQEVSGHPEDSDKEVVFTLGMPAPGKKDETQDMKPPPDTPDSPPDPTATSSASDPLSPSDPAPSSPDSTKESSKGSAPPDSTVSSTASSVNTPSHNTWNSPSAATTGSGNVPRTNPINIPQSQGTGLGEIPSIPSSDPGSSGFKNSKHDKKSEKEDEEEDKTFTKEETLAESSLPWRRQTSLPPVPSSVSLSLPDDENPLMSEAPSWADNLRYHNLTETGSPSQSPQNTITAQPPVNSPRPVFDIFPPSSPPHSESAIPSIPPPWSVTDNDTDRRDEALPSQSLAARDTGDKASCMLVSAHDLVPPSYHSCLEPSHGLEPPISRRHSQASSPIHFPVMEKPESVTLNAIESQLIGIEADYHHAMADRVSRWLANTNIENIEHEEAAKEQARKEEGERILESLRQKKEKGFAGDTDDGTDADVESDCEMQDTKL